MCNATLVYKNYPVLTANIQQIIDKTLVYLCPKQSNNLNIYNNLEYTLTRKNSMFAVLS